MKFSSKINGDYCDNCTKLYSEHQSNKRNCPIRQSTDGVMNLLRKFPDPEQMRNPERVSDLACITFSKEEVTQIRQVLQTYEYIRTYL